MKNIQRTFLAIVLTMAATVAGAGITAHRSGHLTRAGLHARVCVPARLVRAVADGAVAAKGGCQDQRGQRQKLLPCHSVVPPCSGLCAAAEPA